MLTENFWNLQNPLEERISKCPYEIPPSEILLRYGIKTLNLGLMGSGVFDFIPFKSRKGHFVGVGSVRMTNPSEVEFGSLLGFASGDALREDFAACELVWDRTHLEEIYQISKQSFMRVCDPLRGDSLTISFRENHYRHSLKITSCSYDLQKAHNQIQSYLNA